MARWRALKYAALTLVRVLQHRCDAEGIAVDVQLATAQTFQQLASVRDSTITVFLYRVLENAEMRNSPHRVGVDGRQRRTPIVVELGLLITPWGARPSTTLEADANAAGEEAELLGLILQTVRSHAELSRADLYDDPPPPPLPPTWDVADSAQMFVESLALDEQYQIWDAGEQPYRPSIACRMRVIGLDGELVPAAPPVVDAAFTTGTTR